MIVDRIALIIASGLGLGYLALSLSHWTRVLAIPERWTGSGLLGSCLGLGMVLIGFPVSGWAGLGCLAGLTIVAVWASGRAEGVFGVKDDTRIVIDEVVGMAWSVAFLPVLFMGKKEISVLIAAFVLFRVFDVAKLPLKRVQNLQGGIGIVADDFLAGLLTNLILQVGVRVIF